MRGGDGRRGLGQLEVKNAENCSEESGGGKTGRKERRLMGIEEEINQLRTYCETERWTDEGRERNMKPTIGMVNGGEEEEEGEEDDVDERYPLIQLN
jgi:hypothetical protein